MGTPNFSIPGLEALFNAGYQIDAVFTQPPRRKGRGHSVQPSPVHLWAEQKGIPVHTPFSLRMEDIHTLLKNYTPAVIVVIAYGLILPDSILTIPRYGCINVHASLLPYWRGAAPMQHAILAGDSLFGVTLMKMDTGMDTGPILAQNNFTFSKKVTYGEVYDKTAKVGAELLIKKLPDYLNQKIIPVDQNSSQATYAPKITKEDVRLDWHRPARFLERQVRAFHPSPGVWFLWKEKRFKIWEAEVIEDKSSGPPGIVIDDYLTVQCGVGRLRLKILQKPGGVSISATDFLRGCPIAAGERLL